MKVKKDTIIRTIILALALINQILVSTGHDVLPVSDEQVTQIITLIFTIGASVWAWWKNNSFTQHAIAGDNYKNELKVLNKR